MLSANDCWQFVAFKAMTGSHAYGLAIDGSDEDWRGMYAPPTAATFELNSLPEQITTEVPDVTFWEARKFVKLILENNPNVLETLWSYHQEFPDEMVEEVVRDLIAERHQFLSKRLINTYGGYATQQWQRGLKYLAVEDDPNAVRHGWKHLMHLCRLLLSGAYALRTGELLVNVGEHRHSLLDIRAGTVPLVEVEQWHRELDAKFNEAKSDTELPDQPNVDEANAFLITLRIRRLNYPILLRGEMLE